MPDLRTELPAEAQPHFRLRLFVAVTSLRSQQAIASMRRICARHLEGRVDLEIIDIYQQPEAAEIDQVIAAPTLVRLEPAPVRRIIGDLLDEARVLRALGATMPL